MDPILSLRSRTASLLQGDRMARLERGGGFPPLGENYKKEKDTMKVSFFRAGKGDRTLDIDLGKVALYQLSYSRECSKFNKKGRFVKGFWKFGAIFALLCLRKRF